MRNGTYYLKNCEHCGKDKPTVLKRFCYECYHELLCTDCSICGAEITCAEGWVAEDGEWICDNCNGVIKHTPKRT